MSSCRHHGAVRSWLREDDTARACSQMRERMQNENRQGFTDRQGRPLEFSSFQMTHFLKSAKHK